MNNHDAPPLSTDEPAAHELPAIEFESPGRFAIHNPVQLMLIKKHTIYFSSFRIAKMVKKTTYKMWFVFSITLLD